MSEKDHKDFNNYTKCSLLCFMICKTIICILSLNELENIISKQILYQKQ